MIFNIDHNEAWIQAKLQQEGEQNLEVGPELSEIANKGRLGEFSDREITRGEIHHRDRRSAVRPLTRHLLSHYFNNKVTRSSETLTTQHGRVLEELLIFDDDNKRFSEKATHRSDGLTNQQTDLILRRKRVPNRETTDPFERAREADLPSYENVTDLALKAADTILYYFYELRDSDETSTLVLKKETIDLNQIFEDIKNDDVPDRNPIQQKLWEDLDILSNINFHFLVQLYRIHSMAIYARDFEPIHLREAISFSELRKTIDTGFPALKRRKKELRKSKQHLQKVQNQKKFELENKFISNSLSSIITLSSEQPLQSSSHEIGLVVTSANHMIDMTDGEYGIDVLRDINHDQWNDILNEPSLAESIFTTLSNSVYVQSVKFYRNLYGEDKDIRFTLLEDILLSTPTEHENGEYFKILTACALAVGMKRQLGDLHLTLDEFAARRVRDNGTTPENVRERRQSCVRDFCEKNDLVSHQFTIGELIHFYLRKIHNDSHGQSYAFSSVVDIALTTMGTLSRRPNLPGQFRTDSVQWNKRFLSDFETFYNPDSSENEKVRQRSDDRQMIQKSLRVLSSLDAKAAQRFLFQRQMHPLNPNFDPRADQIHLAYDAYYLRVGGAETLARVARQQSLAFARQLDQDNNEWGRDFEQALADPLFRWGTIGFGETDDHHAVSKKSVQKIVAAYDPEGLLQRNLAFVHVLRYFYTHSNHYNPLRVARTDEARQDLVALQDRILKNLNLRGVVNQNLPDKAYRPHQDFTRWIQALQSINPDFFEKLKTMVDQAPFRQVKLSFETFFLEVNETETFHYFLNPIQGQSKIMDFVGRIRSWTSGYHGRLLSRMQIFFDQDAIRQGKLGSDGVALHPEHPDILAHYEETVGLDHFHSSQGVYPYLVDAEQGTDDPRYQFTVDEAEQILSYLSRTGFTAYIPHWAFFIIEHRFSPASPVLLHQAFDALAKTRFPKHLMEEEFEKRGYLLAPYDPRVSQEDKERQEQLNILAQKCLRKLPRATAKSIRFDDPANPGIRAKILFGSHRPKRMNPRRLQRKISRFTSEEPVGPGQYYRYRRLSKRLRRTHEPEAIQAILDEGLRFRQIDYPKNTPFKPLFRGLLRYLITDRRLNESIETIAVSSADQTKGPLNFSALLVRWAKRNRIDLNEVFGKAFASHTPPGPIKDKYDQLVYIEEQIQFTESQIISWENIPDQDQESVIAELTKLRDKLHGDNGLLTKQQHLQRELIALFDDLPRESYDQQVIIQVVTYLYNAVRKQYLKEVLITGDEVSAGIIEDKLQTELIPERERLLRRSNGIMTGEIEDLDVQIEFLYSILAELEGTQYVNDYVPWTRE